MCRQVSNEVKNEATFCWTQLVWAANLDYVEEEGTDYKVDITFDKAGHKRLMAKFAGLEIMK